MVMMKLGLALVEGRKPLAGGNKVLRKVTERKLKIKRQRQYSEVLLILLNAVVA